MVAGQGALVNSRLDHLLGFESIKQFIDDVEAGEIERLRQAALYADHDGTELLLPENRISEEAALFHLTLAGELMAEVLGFEPETWNALREEVKTSSRRTATCATKVPRARAGDQRVAADSGGHPKKGRSVPRGDRKLT